MEPANTDGYNALREAIKKHSAKPIFGSSLSNPNFSTKEMREMEEKQCRVEGGRSEVVKKLLQGIGYDVK